MLRLLFRCGGSGLGRLEFALVRVVNQHQIPGIDDKAARLSDNKHQVFLMNGVNEEKKSAKNTENPKRQGHGTFSFPFRDNPLNEKSASEHSLRDQSKNDPYIHQVSQYIQDVFHRLFSFLFEKACIRKSLLLVNKKPSLCGETPLPYKFSGFSHLTFYRAVGLNIL
jgi:hypothetical protein